MDNFNIRDAEFKRRSVLLEQFADNGLEKAISSAEFDKKYGQGYQVFSTENINRFLTETTAEHDPGTVPEELVKGLQNELSTLTKIVVQTENGYVTRFVKEISQESAPADISKGDVETEVIENEDEVVKGEDASDANTISDAELNAMLDIEE